MSTNKDEEFVQQIRDALTYLYDHAYLQRHPLAERLVSPQIAATRTRRQELRRILLDAIEALRPAVNVPVWDVERGPADQPPQHRHAAAVAAGVGDACRRVSGF